MKEILKEIEQLSLEDQVCIFEKLGNDILKVRTKQAYARELGKSSRAYLWAKGIWIRFKDCDLVTTQPRS